MAKLFLSYSREDKNVVEKLVAALETAAHKVWWDRHIQAGSMYEKDIEKELNDADAVIVAWSPSATESSWVKDEASFARDKNKLIPICINACEAPLGFRQYQVIQFEGWKGEETASAFQSLLSAIAGKTGAQAPAPPPVPSLFQQIADKAKSHTALIAAAAGTLLIAAITTPLMINQQSQDNTEIPAPEVARKEVSIAVLPFADMSPEGNQEYFADGLSEELLNVLVRIDGLKVASRTSAFAMKDKPLSIGEIAELLKVDHIVEGSIRKTGNRIRITAQLIDAKSDRHLWSDTFDRHLSDIFRIQDEIANSVLTALRDELGMNEKIPVLVTAATENLDAYDMYLKAREKFLARGRTNVRESLGLFEQIVDMQPDYPEAWEGLSAVYAIATSWGITDRDYSALSLDAAKKALELDPNLSMPYAVIGLTYRTHYPTPWEESLNNLLKAIAANPKNTNAYLWLGMDYMALGYHDKALEAFTNCLEIDDAFKLCKKYKSIVHLFKGEVNEAMAYAEQNAEAGYFGDFDVYIPVLLNRDDRLTAFTVSRTLNWWADFPHSDYIDVLTGSQDNLPVRFAELEEWAKGRKVDLLDKTNLVLAYRAYDKISVETFDNDYEDLWLPSFSEFRSTSEFKNLTKGLGLTDYWLAHGFPEQCTRSGDEDFNCT